MQVVVGEVVWQQNSIRTGEVHRTNSRRTGLDRTDVVRNARALKRDRTTRRDDAVVVDGELWRLLVAHRPQLREVVGVPKRTTDVDGRQPHVRTLSGRVDGIGGVRHLKLGVQYADC